MILKRKTEKTSRSHKVSEIVRKAISEVLVKNELPLDTPFEFPINVVKVEMNSDLKIAYVYVVAHEKIDETETILKLNSCKQYLSREVTSLINLKFSYLKSKILSGALIIFSFGRFIGFLRSCSFA